MMPVNTLKQKPCLFKTLHLVCRSLLLTVVLSLWNNCKAVDTDVVFTERAMQVAASYLYHFTQFTTWAVSSPTVHFCVYEDDEFTEILQEAYREKPELEVKNINVQSELNACQLIYFSKNPPPDFLQKISKLPVLTVGIQQGFTEAGGIIHLYEDDQKLRFFINYPASITAGLKISSQLLQLSREQ